MAQATYIGIAEPGAIGWWLSFPALPGCISATQRFEDLARSGREALEDVLVFLQRTGTPLPTSVEDGDGGKTYDPANYHNPQEIMVVVELPAGKLLKGRDQ